MSVCMSVAALCLREVAVNASQNTRFIYFGGVDSALKAASLSSWSSVSATITTIISESNNNQQHITIKCYNIGCKCYVLSRLIVGAAWRPTTGVAYNAIIEFCNCISVVLYEHMMWQYPISQKVRARIGGWWNIIQFLDVEKSLPLI